MFSSRGTVRYEERGQGYRDVERLGNTGLGLCLVYIFKYAAHIMSVYPGWGFSTIFPQL